MTDYKISLCIPTMDRYDDFLNENINNYIKLLDDDIIDEIIINDENGNDYNKIINNSNYKKYIDNSKLLVYKNDKILGVFLNKLQVCKLANNDIIALIDSDNTANKDYFLTVKDYIKHNNLPESYILNPTHIIGGSDLMNCENYTNDIITKKNIRNYIVEKSGPEQTWDIPLMWNIKFITMINTGNYVLTKNIININYDDKLLQTITSCDVMYFNLLAFKQIPNLEYHFIKDLKYIHRIHENSIYVKTHQNCSATLWEYLVPEYYYNI